MLKPVTASFVPAAVALFMAFGSPAEANTFVKFYTGTTGYAGNYSGSGTVYNDTKSLSTACPSTGSCTSGGGDNIQTTLSFTSFGLTASANSTLKAWDDLSPNFGGMGVGSGSTGSDTDDNINGTNILTLTFTSTIDLIGVATLFDSGHGPFGNGSQLTGDFLLSVNGGTFQHITFANANDEKLNLTGKTFAFEEDGSWNPTFYVSALDYTATPLPAALPLFATGLGAMGLAGWRRKRKNAAALAAA
jgi:hypothetical protein